MLFHNCPITVGLGKIRRSFIHYLGYAMHQRSVNDIAVARDPANICSAEKDVLFFKFKDPLGSSIEMRKVATCAVHYTLGFASRPRSIENVKRMSAFNWLRRAVWLSTIHYIMPPEILWSNVDLIASALENYYVLHRGQGQKRLIHHFF